MRISTILVVLIVALLGPVSASYGGGKTQKAALPENVIPTENVALKKPSVLKRLATSIRNIPQSVKTWQKVRAENSARQLFNEKTRRKLENAWKQKNIFGNRSLYNHLFKNPDYTKALLSQWYGEVSATEMITRITDTLGAQFIPLLMDPGIVTRLEDFLEFAKDHLDRHKDEYTNLRNKGVAKLLKSNHKDLVKITEKDLESLRKQERKDTNHVDRDLVYNLRKLYEEKLGTTKVYRNATLTPWELNNTLENGLNPPGIHPSYTYKSIYGVDNNLVRFFQVLEPKKAAETVPPQINQTFCEPNNPEPSKFRQFISSFTIEDQVFSKNKPYGQVVSTTREEAKADAVNLQKIQKKQDNNSRILWETPVERHTYIFQTEIPILSLIPRSGFFKPSHAEPHTKYFVPLWIKRTNLRDTVQLKQNDANSTENNRKIKAVKGTVSTSNVPPPPNSKETSPENSDHHNKKNELKDPLEE